jgi:hypothetical protein
MAWDCELESPNRARTESMSTWMAESEPVFGHFLLTLPQVYAFEFGVWGYPAALLAWLFATSASGLGLRVYGFRV